VPVTGELDRQRGGKIMTDKPKEDKAQEEKQGFFSRIRETLYGMSAHDMSRYAMRTRASMEHLFILITMGDLIGVPILPPYYSLRLLPYVVPNISTWKRRMLREKDVSDAMF
jgi:hypothetical protein